MPDSPGDVSTLRDVRDSILVEMRAGFERVNGRLDVQNGRIGKLEIEVGKHAERIKTLFARMFERRHHQRREEDEHEKRPITRRDVALVVGGGAGLLAAIKFLVWIAPALKALTS